MKNILKKISLTTVFVVIFVLLVQKRLNAVVINNEESTSGIIDNYTPTITSQAPLASDAEPIQPVAPDRQRQNRAFVRTFNY